MQNPIQKPTKLDPKSLSLPLQGLWINGEGGRDGLGVGIQPSQSSL